VGVQNVTVPRPPAAGADSSLGYPNEPFRLGRGCLLDLWQGLPIISTNKASRQEERPVKKLFFIVQAAAPSPMEERLILFPTIPLAEMPMPLPNEGTGLELELPDGQVLHTTLLGYALACVIDGPHRLLVFCPADFDGQKVVPGTRVWTLETV
jgi:hypothetical protein